MASSDNVVRAGFTPKYKDIGTLTNMLTYRCGSAEEQKMEPLNFRNCRFSALYDPPIEEFSVIRTDLDNAEENIDAIQGPSLMIATTGSGKLISNQSSFDLKEGSVWFIGAGQKIKLASQGKLVTHLAYVEA
jgi:mannose-6-phosphate isomerase